jgi:SAM-dependent methyltransferase
MRNNCLVCQKVRRLRLYSKNNRNYISTLAVLASMKTLRLKSIRQEDAAVDVPVDISNLAKPFSGLLAAQNGDEYAVRQNILYFNDELDYALTLAQRSNFLSVTADSYESVWRTRSLSILTGEAFPIEKERELLLEWVQPKDSETILDLACSTAVYGRFVLSAAPLATVWALDFSPEMLLKAREYLVSEKKNAFLLCADAVKTPFFSKTFDVAVCGGSLNEFADPLRVLYELRRTMKENGRVFMMYLKEADSWTGKIAQQGAKLGGIHFFSPSYAKELFERAGFSLVNTQSAGIVTFSLLKPA